VGPNEFEISQPAGNNATLTLIAINTSPQGSRTVVVKREHVAKAKCVSDFCEFCRAVDILEY